LFWVRKNQSVRNVLWATGDLILKPDHHQETNAPARGEGKLKVINSISVYENSETIQSAEQPRAVGGTPPETSEAPPRP